MNPYAPPNARVSDVPHDGRPSVWVTKLLALFFGLVALYSCTNLFYSPTVSPIVTAGLCAAASFGLWGEKPWSKWIVYLISMLLCVYFAWYVATLLQSGWPYEGAIRSFAVLIPGALLLFFGVTAAAYVGRVFAKS